MLLEAMQPVSKEYLPLFRVAEAVEMRPRQTNAIIWEELTPLKIDLFRAIILRILVIKY